jgi:peptidoglycan/xylan/chitin deacetylase (PgdA/CDA1 family)
MERFIGVTSSTRSARLADEKIVLTFDYELFLGHHSGTVDNCLIRPTREILQRLQAHSASALFFVDATYLHRIETEDPASYAKVAEQIEAMVDAGCEVGLHLHTHWLDAVRTGTDTWCLDDISRYRLHTLGSQDLTQVFGQSLASLRRAVARANVRCAINTFRAGGWCLQPFALLRPLFLDNGLLYEYSVTAGLYKDTLPGHFYDYRLAPKDLCAWRFTQDPCIPESDGAFIEVPVSAFKASRTSLIANHFCIRGQALFGDGRGVSKGRLRELADKLLATESTRQLTLEMSSLPLLQESLLRTSGRALRVFASHPKMFSTVSLDNLDWLLQRYTTVKSSQVAGLLDGSNPAQPAAR